MKPSEIIEKKAIRRSNQKSTPYCLSHPESVESRLIYTESLLEAIIQYLDEVKS
jgi:hypothetical protein